MVVIRSLEYLPLRFATCHLDENGTFRPLRYTMWVFLKDQLSVPTEIL